MFKLQRLEITGFKSFADHTEIVFTGDGITAVVGPNGCGKSNVADAIAWVLGEQKIKHLRGAEMKDVIFQGSRNRQPSGMAEVVLHMDRDDIDSTLEEIDDQAVQLESLTTEASSETPASTESSLIATEENVEGATPVPENVQETTSSETATAQIDSADTQAETIAPKIH